MFMKYYRRSPFWATGDSEAGFSIPPCTWRRCSGFTLKLLSIVGARLHSTGDVVPYLHHEFSRGQFTHAAFDRLRAFHCPFMHARLLAAPTARRAASILGYTVTSHYVNQITEVVTSVVVTSVKHRLTPCAPSSIFQTTYSARLFSVLTSTNSPTDLRMYIPRLHVTQYSAQYNDGSDDGLMMMTMIMIIHECHR